MTVLRNIGQLATCSANAAQQDAGLIKGAALVFEDKKIVWVGSERSYPNHSTIMNPLTAVSDWLFPV